MVSRIMIGQHPDVFIEDSRHVGLSSRFLSKHILFARGGSQLSTAATAWDEGDGNGDGDRNGDGDGDGDGEWEW